MGSWIMKDKCLKLSLCIGIPYKELLELLSKCFANFNVYINFYLPLSEACQKRLSSCMNSMLSIEIINYMNFVCEIIN